MSRFNPSQTSFIGGELSPKLRAQVGSDLYKAALASCLNWQLTPWHTAYLAPGTTHTATISGAKRLVPLRLAGEQDRQLVLGGGVAKMYDAAGVNQLAITATNLLTNGDFSGGLTGWTSYVYSGFDTTHIDTIGGRLNLRPSTSASSAVYQKITLAAPTVVTLAYDCGKILPDRANKLEVMVMDAGTPFDWAGHSIYWANPVAYGSTVVALNGGAPLAAGDYWVVLFSYSEDGWFDNVQMVAGSAYTDIPIPWSNDQLADVQWVSETGADRTIFVHPNVQPWAIQRLKSGAWVFGNVTFANIPQVDPASPGVDLWAGYNWPGAIDLFQGRLWLGGVPSQANRVFASMVGSVFDFATKVTISGTPTVTAICAIDELASTRGSIRWLKGKGPMMLVGTDQGDGAIAAQGAITPLDFHFRDESDAGSAHLQPALAGNQALYVSEDFRKVRSVSFSNQAQAWESDEVTYTAEHITEPLVKEIHFARAPHSTLLCVLQDGTLACCTYDAKKQMAGWWRRETAGSVLSLSVSNGPSGSIVFQLVSRSGVTHLERMPMSELDAGTCYVDSAVKIKIDYTTRGGTWRHQIYTYDTPYVSTAPTPPASWDVGATFSLTEGNALFLFEEVIGMDLVFGAGGRLRILSATSWYEGVVRVIEPLADSVKAGLCVIGGTLVGTVDWQLETPSVLTGLIHLEGQTVRVIIDGSVETDQVVASGAVPLPRSATSSIVIGLPYTATMELLPLEGGLATGSSQSAKRRRTKVRLRLNDSAIPTVNGKRPPERRPADPMDTGTDRVTGDVDCNVVGWSEDGALTIVQALPLRTEILAVFGNAVASEV